MAGSDDTRVGDGTPDSCQASTNQTFEVLDGEMGSPMMSSSGVGGLMVSSKKVHRCQIESNKD